jgi:hypothetical protein
MSAEQATIGELFPHDDLIGQWVFSLSVLTDDLQLLFIEQKEALAAQPELRKSLFLQRILIVRLYEARRLVLVTESHREIRDFIGANNEFFERLRTYYLPPEASPVDKLYAVLRHQSVHYMWPGSDELATTLRGAAWLPARTRVLKSPTEVEIEWVQAVAGLGTLGEISAGGWKPRYEERARLSAAIQQSWIMLYAVMIAVYAHRRGIPLERFMIVADDLGAIEGGPTPGPD